MSFLCWIFFKKSNFGLKLKKMCLLIAICVCQCDFNQSRCRNHHRDSWTNSDGRGPRVPSLQAELPDARHRPGQPADAISPHMYMTTSLILNFQLIKIHFLSNLQPTCIQSALWRRITTATSSAWRPSGLWDMDRWTTLVTLKFILLWHRNLGKTCLSFEWALRSRLHMLIAHVAHAQLGWNSIGYTLRMRHMLRMRDRYKTGLDSELLVPYFCGTKRFKFLYFCAATTLGTALNYVDLMHLSKAACAAQTAPTFVSYPHTTSCLSSSSGTRGFCLVSVSLFCQFAFSIFFSHFSSMTPAVQWCSRSCPSWPSVCSASPASTRAAPAPTPWPTPGSAHTSSGSSPRSPNCCKTMPSLQIIYFYWIIVLKIKQ